MTYNRDLQEDKEALFDTVDTLRLVLEVFAEMIGGMGRQGGKDHRCRERSLATGHGFGGLSGNARRALSSGA